MNIHLLHGEMQTLVRTFSARFVVQEDVDKFDMVADSVDQLTVETNDNIFIGRPTTKNLELCEGEGIIGSEEKRNFYK